jgi:adenylate cyclase
MTAAEMRLGSSLGRAGSISLLRPIFKGILPMAELDVSGINAWVTEAGLSGASEPDLLRGFCKRVVYAGLPLFQATIVIDTLHPVYEGRVFRWRRDQAGESTTTEYGRTSDPVNAEGWRRSTFFHLLESGGSELRRCLARGDAADFPILEELQEQGQTDYLALIHRFGSGAVIGEMDCVYSSWTTDAPDGFSESQLGALMRAMPVLALAIKSASLARIAETLVETYLGRDAGRRVLKGDIARGVTDTITAVLWYSDLRGFTHITDTAPEQVIPLLNDYADATISSVYEAGGDVLKLIGDGTLAMFKSEDLGEACRCALQAEALARSRIGELNLRRTSRSLPVTRAYMGLHVGEAFYGNIGSQDRLDFTVVGPAVNEVSRIAAMCQSIERDTLLSSSFVAAAFPEDRNRFVSVGRYALRGVTRSQELFTLEPTD